ncbi:MAG TPA: DUF481 domain-containing protein [Chryseolinea sp.]
MHATSRNFRVETLQGEVLEGYLTRSDTAGMVWVSTSSKRKKIQVNDIVEMSYYGKTWKSRITGNASSGFTYTKSSQIGRLNMDGLLRYNTSKNQTQLQGSMIMTYDSVDVGVERANVDMSYGYAFGTEWAAIVLVRYQRNVELGLDRRWQEAIGIARRFMTNKTQQASVVPGIAVNQERNLEGTESSTAEALLQLNYDLYSFISPNLTINFAETGYVSLTESNRIRSDGDISFDYELIKDFYINLQFFHNYDSRSPATDKPNVDYGFVAGLRVKF